MTDSSKELKHWLAFKHQNLCVFENWSKENQNLHGDCFMFQVYEICLSLLNKSYILHWDNSNLREKCLSYWELELSRVKLYRKRSEGN